jgi:putative tryptophan/tyrosine transport system substrate-binding protein
MDRLSRRAFVVSAAGLGLLAACGRLPWQAQQPAKLPRVGVLGERSPTDPFVEAFRQGLQEFGYAEGQNIVVEYRYAYGAADQFPTLAAELLDLNVDVLVVGGAVAAPAAKARTATVPIVFTLPGDPVGLGLVASLAHPSGNATGLSTFLAPGMIGKQLELLKMAVPHVSHVAVLYSPVNPGHGAMLTAAQEAAGALAVELQAVEIPKPNQLASAFAALRAQGADALLALSDPVLGNQAAQLGQLTAEHRLPAIYVRREYAEAGGLMAYGPNYADNWRRAAYYVDKILKGTSPADLPVEQPMRFDFVVNLKTAQALGITFPNEIMLQVTEVFQ